ncbi:amino acid permease [Mycetocola reblochoni]|uniref:amino acid permease n=1 Tax=Mycetocola reblochoni TaxID=331618 RepID=UPI001FE5962D|nr:amino acid permease [Mycetocola reblochoni]
MDGALDTAAAVEDAGYRKALGPRQIQMIAIGGAIGTGLFMGAGGRLASAGPSLIILYAVCGLFAFFILRALGELVLHRPSSGSFVSYAREFYGEKMAFVSGWLYFGNWAMIAIVDVTAAALYVRFWAPAIPWLNGVPQWCIALAALVVVLVFNLVSVKLFGELEFWFAAIKVGALLAFLVVGVSFLIAVGRTDVGDTGIHLIAENGGMAPLGALPIVVAFTGVVFAYTGIELVGTAAGETKDPRRQIPRAINTVFLRIVLFYVGSVVLLCLLLPYWAYRGDESPFVTFFTHIGIEGADAVSSSVMNLVVLTAALSSLNAGLYSTGRILRSMALSGAAPTFTARLNRNGVPAGGIVLTAVVALGGVAINALWPSDAFNIVLELSAIGIIGAWGTIILCQMKLQRWAAAGRLQRPAFRLWGAPVTSWLTLGFLVSVLVSMAFSDTGRWILASLLVIVPLLVGGWFGCRRRIHAIAAARDGHTGAVPVVAERPGWASERGRPE